MQSNYQSVTKDYILNLLGVEKRELIYPDEMQNILKYQIVKDNEEEELINSIKRTIELEDMRTVGKNDNAVWERGWNETLSLVKNAKDFNTQLLAPKYLDKHKILRFAGQYIKT